VGLGSHVSLHPTVTSDVESIYKPHPGLVVGGGEHRCLTDWLGTTAKGRCSHWGLSAHKCQRYTLIFSPHFSNS
jgi:hypothetical protein